MRNLRLDGGHQLFSGVRLRKKTDDGHLEAAWIVRRDAGDHDRGNRAEPPVAPLLLHEFPAVHHRHHQVAALERPRASNPDRQRPESAARSIERNTTVSLGESVPGAS